MIHLGDITKIEGSKVSPVEVVIGGSPCQDLSVAGKRAGLAGEHSGLFMEQIRLIKEMREHDRQIGTADVRPRYMVWENVPGAFSTNGGEDFRAVLEETAGIVDSSTVIPRPKDGWSDAGAIMGEGWSLAWRVFDAQFWGVPQRRRRIALVADFGGYNAPEILFERKSLSGCTPKSKEARKGSSSVVEKRIGGADTAVFTLDRVAFNQGENARYDFAVDNNGVNPTLTAKGASAVYDARGNGDGKVSPTLTGDHESRITDYTAICLQNISGDDIAGTLDASYYKGVGSRGGKEREIVYMATQQGCAAIDCRNGTENTEVNGTLQAKSTGGSSLNLQNVVRYNNCVRRLTPLECERLQGFPDGWTQIGEVVDYERCYDEFGNEFVLAIYEYIDESGKKRKTSDAARYKAIGNSIALPPWEWLLSRLIEYCTEKTMASLFDGIGGFPLIWSRLGGTCLWASEIEEFPIAVTKYHFGG